MRKLRAVILLLVVSLPLAGCYYDPGSRYVRNGSGADAYYGEETTTTVSPGFYNSGYGYSDFGDFDGYGYGGCCFTGGLNTVWFGGDRRYYRDRYDNGPRRPPPGGGWNGHDGGDRRPPPGGWHGGDGHGPGGDRPRPPGGWQGGGDRPRPPGGWQGGGDRPRPPGGWQGGGGPRPSGYAPRGDGDRRPASSGGSRPSAPRGDGGGNRGQSRRDSN